MTESDAAAPDEPPAGQPRLYEAASGEAEVAALRDAAREQMLEIGALSERLTTVARQEAELRTLLQSAHVQLLERDRKLQQLVPIERDLAQAREEAAALRHERNLLAGRREGVERSRAWQAVLLLRRLKQLVAGR